MKRGPRAVLVSFVLLWLLALSALVEAADQPLKITEMEVLVSPEYDDTGVLVIYSAVFLNQSNSNYSDVVSFRVPADAEISETCHLVENQKGEEEHLCQLPSVQVFDDYKIVSWKVEEPVKPGGTYKAYMEFYSDKLIQGSPVRNIDYQFTPLHNVDSLHLSIRQPLRSTDFKAEPSPVNYQSSADGFKYYNYSFNNVSANSSIRVKFSYTKNDPNPSVEKKQQQSTASGTASSSPARTSPGLDRTAVYVLVVLLVAAIAVAFSYAIRTQGRKLAYEGAMRARPGRMQERGQRGGDKARGDFGADLESQKRRARELLLQGKISEDTYKQLIKDIERERKR